MPGLLLVEFLHSIPPKITWKISFFQNINSKFLVQTLFLKPFKNICLAVILRISINFCHFVNSWMILFEQSVISNTFSLVHIMKVWWLPLFSNLRYVLLKYFIRLEPLKFISKWCPKWCDEHLQKCSLTAEALLLHSVWQLVWNYPLGIVHHVVNKPNNV